MKTLKLNQNKCQYTPLYGLAPPQEFRRLPSLLPPETNVETRNKVARGSSTFIFAPLDFGILNCILRLSYVRLATKFQTNGFIMVCYQE